MKFSQNLIRWFKKNKRNLPWRKTKDPYLIWLSEIILQQTRVDQGLPYYHKFVTEFPTIRQLASAKEDEVLKFWQGLGYYTRARNLHHTAKTICEKYGGRFPENYEEILKLKGVGKYTAAAIVSFAYKLPYPVVDGNVQRVLARIFGVSEPVHSSLAEKKFYALAGKLIDKKKPDEFNQAIMEFGALQCTPVNPDCSNCIPFKQDCIAFKTNRTGELPIRQKKAKQRIRYFNYLVIQDGKNVYLKKRTKNDIWKNLYEFPLIESEKELGRDEITGSRAWKEIKGKKFFRVVSVSPVQIHNLSHQKIYARFWEIRLSGKAIKGTTLSPFLEVKKSEIKNFAVPRIIGKYLDY